MSHRQPHSSGQTVVGRDWELEFMGGFLRDASEAGGALLLLGELGVGKTALLQATGQLAETFGYRVVRTSGAEFEADVNYSGLNQALLALSDNLASLNAVHKEALSVALGLGRGSLLTGCSFRMRRLPSSRASRMSSPS